MIEANRQINIGGPCAAESREQVLTSARMAIEHNVPTIRAPLWKPRTNDGGFEGVGILGIPWLEDAAKLGVIPATEVLIEEHASQVINAISGKMGKKVMVWMGSRNQNHLVQRGIGNLVKGEKLVTILIKNQPWADEKHWMGIISFVISGGADPNQIILCHRGFAPGTDGLRNRPDFDMAMRVKKNSGLPMLIDPSHIGGTTKKVLEIIKQAQDFEKDGVGFDGLMVEVHPNPAQALTDKDQQLSWEEFGRAKEGIIFQA